MTNLICRYVQELRRVQPASGFGVGVHILVVHIFFLGLGLSPQEHVAWITTCAICDTCHRAMIKRAAESGHAKRISIPFGLGIYLRCDCSVNSKERKHTKVKEKRPTIRASRRGDDNTITSGSARHSVAFNNGRRGVC